MASEFEKVAGSEDSCDDKLFYYGFDWATLRDRLERASGKLRRREGEAVLSLFLMERRVWDHSLGFSDGLGGAFGCGLFGAQSGSADAATPSRSITSPPLAELPTSSGACEYVSVLLDTECYAESTLPLVVADLMSKFEAHEVTDVVAEEVCDEIGWRITVYYRR